MPDPARDLFTPTPIIPDINDILFRHHIHIDGIEVTQSIQHYRADQHLTDETDPRDRGPDNSLTLIANKPALVRVYIRSLFSNHVGIGGSLEVAEQVGIGEYAHRITLSPLSFSTNTAIPNPNYVDQRRNINATLNFIIPERHMFGFLRLKVRVEYLSFSESTEIFIDSTLRQTLRLAGILISYNGPNSSQPPTTNLTLAAPTLADLRDTAQLTLDMFPVQSAATFRTAGTTTTTLNTPLDDPASSPGECTPNWDSLIQILVPVRTNDGNRNDVIYYGLLPARTPVGTTPGTVAGCTDFGISAGRSGDQVTMAHEIGHFLGLQHAPCNVTGKLDSKFPVYEPYTPWGGNASIGEFGVNMNSFGGFTGAINILDPRITSDIMSYCPNRWISKYHHQQLYKDPLLNPEFVSRLRIDIYNHLIFDPLYRMPEPWPPKDTGIPANWFPDPPPEVLSLREARMIPSPLISIIGKVVSEDKIEVRSVVRLDAFRDIPDAMPTEFFAELIDEMGNVVSKTPLHRFVSVGGCNCSSNKKDDKLPEYPYQFQAFLNDITLGKSLRIRKDDNEIWIRHAPPNPPTIKNIDAYVEGNTLTVKCSIQYSSDSGSEWWLQWSNDDGKSWYGLVTGMTVDEAKFDISTIPHGSILLRLLANDGFSTSKSKPIKLEIPKPSMIVTILSPRVGMKLLEKSPLRLRGLVSYPSGVPGEYKYVKWLIDENEVARDLDVFVETPKEGKHTCTLMVTDDAETISQSREFEVISHKNYAT